MTVPVSSLSIAVEGIADFLDGKFGEDVIIITDTPQRASEKVKSNDNKHLLNLFVYRVMPSGFHADVSSEEPLFIRINVLLTPFLSDHDSATADADLRILGHVMRVLHAHPIVPITLPGDSAGDRDFRTEQHLDYRLQAVLQAPTMEELNHIWTTQGGELPYRLSAAYEFALIPIEPLVHATPAGPMTTAIFDVRPDVEARKVEGFIEFGNEPNVIPLGGRGPNRPPAITNWLPVILIASGDSFTSSGTVTTGTTELDVVLAGVPGERVAVQVSWVRADGTEVVQTPEIFTITSARIDDPAALKALTLTDARTGDRATVHGRPVGENDLPLASSAFSNTLSLAVGAAV